VENGKPKYAAPAAACAADVLIALARSATPLSGSDLADGTGNTKSLVYRVLGELVARGFVIKQPTGTHSLGPAVVELGGAFATSVPLTSSIRRALRRLSDTFGETTNLGTLRGDQVLYLMREEGERSILAISYVGKLLPANAVGLGKALLAEMTDEDVRAMLLANRRGRPPLDALTPKTITSLDELLQDLDVARSRGYAVDHEESVPGRGCLGVAIPLGAGGLGRLAISMSLDESRFRDIETAAVQAMWAARDEIMREALARTAIGEAPSVMALVLADL
jgi:DNA-binding IclR family transcriptional regulator